MENGEGRLGRELRQMEGQREGALGHGGHQVESSELAGKRARKQKLLCRGQGVRGKIRSDWEGRGSGAHWERPVSGAISWFSKLHKNVTIGSSEPIRTD